MSSVHPKNGGPYSLYCDECGCWIPNTANTEMRKEGVIAYSHICENGVCDMTNGEILDTPQNRKRKAESGNSPQAYWETFACLLYPGQYQARNGG